jgi:hypothetical protein
MISLDDAELARSWILAASPQPRERAASLRRLPPSCRLTPAELGAGAVHRVGSRLQRQFLRTVSDPAE